MIPTLASQNRNQIAAKNLPGLEKIVFYSCPEVVEGVYRWQDLASAGDQSHFATLSATKVE